MADATTEHTTQNRTSRPPEVRANPMPPPTSQTFRHRLHDTLRSLPAMSTFPATDEARTHLGRPLSSPTDGLRAQSPLRSYSAMAAFPQPMEPGHTSGARPPLVHHRRATAAAAIAAAPSRFNAPSPTRRTSPVMTNDRVSPPVLILGQNAAVIAPPAADQHPEGRPAAQSVFLPLHPDHLFHPAPNAKTREAQGPAGFGPGAFLPLIFHLCHKQKNKSRTFSQNAWGGRHRIGCRMGLHAICARAPPCPTFGLNVPLAPFLGALSTISRSAKISVL